MALASLNGLVADYADLEAQTKSSSRPSRPPPKPMLKSTSARKAAHRPEKASDRPGSGDCIRKAGQSVLQAQTPAAAAKAKAGPTPAAKAAPKAAMKTAAKTRPCMHPHEDEPLLVIDRAEASRIRSEMLMALRDVPVFDPQSDDRSFHGRAYLGPMETPTVLWKSDKKPRQNSPDWLTATEYRDTAAVFAAKIALLARMLRASQRSLAYTGAGLSVAAGIGMAAQGSSGQGGMGASTAGEPTVAHCVLAELNRQRLLHGWVQQNHDGLPQKAGYRQEEINEIHGSWFDPSNPVVKYSGSLRGDLFDDMEKQANKADLVIVLGTSLTGLNADQCVTTAAARSAGGGALGSVIISPQRTSQDGKASLRIFAKADEVMAALVKELGLGPGALGRRPGIRCSADLFPKDCRVLVPYDKDGFRSTSVKTWWDMSKGAKVRIGPNHNLRGAHQPNDEGIDERTVGIVTGRDEKTCSIGISIGKTTKKLGIWWLETAMRGGMESLPLVNVDAQEVKP